MIRNSSFLIKKYQKQHFRLSKCFKTISTTFTRLSSTAGQSDENSCKNEKYAAFTALSLSFIGAISYYVYNNELKNYLKDFYQVYALHKEKKE